MNKLNKCKKCRKYTLKEEHCNEKTLRAGYKYLKFKKQDKFLID